MEPKSLCVELTVDKIEVESDGMITIPDRPGIGLEINLAGVKKYLVDTEIKVDGKVLYTTPTV